jgi:hypothetical protein
MNGTKRRIVRDGSGDAGNWLCPTQNDEIPNRTAPAVLAPRERTAT